jgi:uncharacterized protein Usg
MRILTLHGGMMTSLKLQLQNYRLTTAQIFYHLPDHPALLQEYVWQEMDLAPKFPVLHKFLAYWESNLSGRLHSVRVAHTELVSPGEFRSAQGAFYIQ